MGKITIFRVTNLLDDETTSDKIEFNTTEETKDEAAFITGFENNPTDGVGDNQGAEQNLGDQQALGEVEDTIKISGFFSKRNGNGNDGLNAFLIKLQEWIDQPKVNDDWDLGRFGVTDVDDQTHNEIPINTGIDQSALLWEKLKRWTDFKGNREMFDLYFRVNRGDGT